MILVGVIGAVLVGRWARKRQEATGRTFPVGWVGARADCGHSRDRLCRPRPAARLRPPGEAALQPERRLQHHARADSVVAGALHLYRRFHLRDRARRHSVRLQGADRGGRRARAEARAHHAQDYPAAGAARDHSTDDQPVPQPDQELLARRRHRLPGHRLDRRHHPQPERAGA